MASIDINVDLGEGDPYDAELLAVASSCNIACGGHAGDAASMLATVIAALENDVVIGAHPSYPDPEGFGRRSGFQSGTKLLSSLTKQIRALGAVVESQGAAIRHVKPHGALYSDAAYDAGLAEIIAKAVIGTVNSASLVGPPDSELARAAARHGLGFVGEAFIDRAYLANGRLAPRTQPGAVHDNLAKILAQAGSLAAKQSVTSIDGKVVAISADTLCVHGDTPGAADAARAVRHELQKQGFEIRGVDK